jgi:hypothetical protein
VRIYLDIGPGGEPPSDFGISELVPARSKEGEPSVGIKVRNTGGRALDLTGSVSLVEGPGGIRAGPFEVTQATTLAAGESGTVTVRFPRDLPSGPWKIEVNLESGMVKRSASGPVTFPDPGKTGTRSKLLSGVDTPWIIIGGSLPVGAAVLVGLALVARRSRRGQ